ncbi:MAG TPA: hypothetical protein VHW01_12365 [Polyangiaceae bacterium]|nr:hypothetical protein [Polyangiaceae bacterium]
MRRIKMMGLCLVAVLAVAAVAVSSASAALPEYKVCAKAAKETAKYTENGKEKSKSVYTGAFSDKLCSVAAPAGKYRAGGAPEGKYELESWEAAKKKGFKGKNGVSTLDSYIPENEATPWTGGTIVGTVSCKSAKSVGELTGPKTSTVTVEFKTCTSEGKKCSSAGQKAGTIKTALLNTTLGYIEAGVVGSDVEAASKGASASFSCEGLEIVTVGSLIGVNTGNVNKVSKEGTQTFNVNAKGGQEVVFGAFPESPITGPAHFLISKITPPGVELPSGQKTTSILKGEALEIAA